MQRRLIVMRHAKSAWPEDVPDFERPLSGRGDRDAAAAGQWMQHQGLRPEVALVSSARRTRATADAVAAAVDASHSSMDIRVSDGLYGAGAGDLLDAVRDVEDAHSTVLLIAHNPGIGMLVALLDDGGAEVEVGGPGGVGYPTSATTVFDVSTPWGQLDPGAARRSEAHTSE